MDYVLLEIVSFGLLHRIILCIYIIEFCIKTAWNSEGSCCSFLYQAIILYQAIKLIVNK